MATTTTITLTDSQREELANNLRVKLDCIPTEIAIVAVSPQAGKAMGMPEDMNSKFSPALIIT